LIAPGSARGTGFPKEKSAASAGDRENHIGIAAQYLQIILLGLFNRFYSRGDLKSPREFVTSDQK